MSEDVRRALAVDLDGLGALSSALDAMNEALTAALELIGGMAGG